MTTKDLYRVFLRLFGVYLFVQHVMLNLTYVLYAFYENMDASGMILSSGVAYLTILFLALMLIFRTDVVIRLLRLEEGMDSAQVETSSISSNNLFQFALVFFGVFLITQNFVPFIMQVYRFITIHITNEIPTVPTFAADQMALNFISILFGLFICLNASKLALWLNKKENHMN